MGNIEDIINEPAGANSLEYVLKRLEIRPAFRVHHHGLTVQDNVLDRQPGSGSGYVREPGGPVEAVS